MKNFGQFLTGFISFLSDGIELCVLVYAFYWGASILSMDDHNQFYGLIMLVAAVVLARVIGISDKMDKWRKR